jgi:nucleoside phosphorylase
MSRNPVTQGPKYVVNVGKADVVTVGDQTQVLSEIRPHHAESPKHADVLLVVATNTELRATRDVFTSRTGTAPTIFQANGIPYYDFGTVGNARVALSLTEPGSGGQGGSQQTVAKAIEALHPSSIILLGIAFGVDASKQNIGDLLVSKQLQPYEKVRVATDHDLNQVIVWRDDRPSASSRLLKQFRMGADSWPEAPLTASFRFGLILSGEKLVDNDAFRKAIVSLGHDKTIGGEMEGAGLYVAAQDAKVDWIVVKAISDWADGHKNTSRDEFQTTAARNAAEYVYYVISLGGFG